MRVTVILTTTIMTCFMMTPLALRAQAPPVPPVGPVQILDVNFQSSTGKSRIGKETDAIIIDFAVAALPANVDVQLESLYATGTPPKAWYIVVNSQTFFPGDPLFTNFWPGQNAPPRTKWWTTPDNSHTVTVTATSPAGVVLGNPTLTFYLTDKTANGDPLGEGWWRIVFPATGVGGGGGGPGN